MTFRRFTRVEAKGELNSYIHGSKIGVIVDVIGGNAELSHDVAMHIAAAKPKALDETGVDQAQIEAERRIAIEKAREAGKPEAMLERIAEGTVKKFLKEVTLVNQPFVKDDKKSVGELVKAAGAQIGGYTLFVVGEGIEKRVDDFANDVHESAQAADSASSENGMPCCGTSRFFMVAKQAQTVPKRLVGSVPQALSESRQGL